MYWDVSVAAVEVFLDIEFFVRRKTGSSENFGIDLRKQTTFRV